MSALQVIGPREQVTEDLRYSTQNTKLASCLLVLGFPLSQPEPFKTVVARGVQPVVTIFFFPYISQDGTGAPVSVEGSQGPRPLLARDVEAEWVENREGSFPCVYWIRRALEARDFLIRDVIHGGRGPTFPTSGKLPKHYKTDSLRDAAVSLSCNAKLIGYRDKQFYFEPKAELFVANAAHPEYKGRERYARLGIEQQNLLMGVITGRTEESKAARVVGNFGTAFIPALMDPRLKEAYLQQIDLGR